jgi:nitrilase
MRVAVAQLAPVLLHRQATLQRVVRAVHEAADQGAELVAFGETLVPGYPWWVERSDGARFDDPVQKRIYARYLDQAVCVADGHLDHVREAAAERQIAVVLGAAERDRRAPGTVFCAAFLIDREGELRVHHRKLVPTYEERLVWGPGDGAGLRTHPVGPFTVGVLNCWENWMPLARAALHGLGETLHVGLWPGNRRNTESIVPFQAREGRSYVVAACGLTRPSDIPDDVPHRDRWADAMPFHGNGGSCVADPRGDFVLSPWVEEEGVRTVELDRSRVLAERQNFDPSGHYARWDVLELQVHRKRAGLRVHDGTPDFNFET